MAGKNKTEVKKKLGDMLPGTRCMFPITGLIHPDYNPREISPDAFAGLRASIKRFGLVQEVVVNRRNASIVGGNKRLDAAIAEGKTEVPIFIVDLPDIEEKALNVALNNPHIAGDFTPELQGLLDEIKMDIGESDFMKLMLDDLVIVSDEPADGLTDADAVPDVSEPVCKAGELWVLGEHRLLCGNATKAEDVERLMDGKKADMVFTDPPYGVNYEGGASNKTKRDKIIGDDTVDLFTPCCLMAFQFTTNESPLYLWHAGTKGNAAAAAAAAMAAGYEIRTELIWHKLKAHYGAFTAQYMQKHEPCYYCFKKGKGVNWIGASNEITVWEVEQSSRNEYHPTQKPVALAERAIGNHKAEKVLDLFGGSGSTLIACERLNRKCYMMEIDESYCDVIIKRWEDFTGNKAVLSNGK